jgi:hypothetical protein
MNKVIKTSFHDKNVALAHSISADIEDERNMSRGVAVVFRNHFARPKSSDFINRHLTCQNIKEGPVVYGLVTKDK